MTGFPSRATVEHLRSVYKEGTRVRLNHMDDFQAPPAGTEGTVMFVDDIGSIHVNWDTGGSLAVAYGVDSCSVIGEGKP